MKMFYCYGKNGLCKADGKCTGCEHYDQSGGKVVEVEERACSLKSAEGKHIVNYKGKKKVFDTLHDALFFIDLAREFRLAIREATNRP